MTINEIKLRRLSNQHLLEPAEMRTVVRDLCGIQAQYFQNAVHSLRIRCSDFSEANIYDQFVKNWTVRGTIHVFDKADLGLFVRCSDGRYYRCNEWTGPSFWNKRTDWSLTSERQSFFTDVIVSALSEHPCTREELRQICVQKGMTDAEDKSMFHPWGGGVREMCERGFMHYAAQDEKLFCLTSEYSPVAEEKAMLELARRYFTNFAPATIHDAMYFFGVSARKVKGWLEQLPVSEAECEGKTYYSIDIGRNYGSCKIPECLFLAGFDQLMMGYEKTESLFLRQEQVRAIYTSSGIVRPAVLLNGDVVGWWSKKQSRLIIKIFEDHSTDKKEAIADKARKLWHDVKRIDFQVM